MLFVGCGESQTQSDSTDASAAAKEEQDAAIEKKEQDAAVAIEKQKQDVAVAAIRKLGGKVTLDEENPGRPLSVNFYGSKVTDAGLEHLKGLAKLQTLALQRTNVTDAGLVHLKGLTNLQALGLAGTKVSDDGVKDLQAALPKCEILK